MLGFIGDQETSATYIFKVSSWESLAAPQRPYFITGLKKGHKGKHQNLQENTHWQNNLEKQPRYRKNHPYHKRCGVYVIYNYFRIE